jgi:CHAT domain-containing protein
MVEGIAAGDAAELAANSWSLYGLLVPPAAQNDVARARHLVIVPTGTLYDLPWEMLVTRKPTTAAPRYLVESLPIAYAASASLLALVRRSESSHRVRGRPLLAFARPAYANPPGHPTTTGTSNDEPFPDLPGSIVEAERVRDALGAPPESVVTAGAASRDTIIKLNRSGQLETYRYVLFATHAVLPNDIPGLDQAALVLADADRNRGTGFLTMSDVFELSLGADFVALSACNTGRRAHEASEGIGGLTRAFLFTGTPAISVALWKVDDAVEARLSPAFFRRMRAGDSPADALRAAKLDLIRDASPRLRHPFSWAPTVIFGDGFFASSRRVRAT